MQNDLNEYLNEFITENKYKKIQSISQMRTRYMSVLLEDIFQPHNASAVVRSCECFGIQDLHIIENKNKYKLNPDVVLGSSKWVNMKQYNTPNTNNTEVAMSKLKSQGYRIIATTPHTEKELDDIDVTQGKFVLMFGTEADGLTDYALEHADERVKIPMYGFTESFNISVSAALCMNFLGTKVRKSGVHWKLSDDELAELRLDWTKKCLKNSDALIENFYKQRNSK